MTSVIYFKLKNAIQQQLVNFDGSVIQIGDVKRLIATKQGLGPDGALELTLSDPNTGDEYTDDGKVIPRNTLVLVKRTPATKFKPLVAGDTGTASQPTKAAAVEADPFGEAPSPAAATTAPGNEFGGDFYSEQPTAAVVNDDESKAMQSFLQGTASTWQREVRQGVMRGRGRGRGGRGAPGSGVAPEYKCPRCDAFGLHWLQDCPTQGDPAYDRKRVRPPVGIPMTRLARSQEGGLVLPDGQTGTLVANEDSFAREILGLGLMQPSQDPTTTGGPASQQQTQQQQEAVLALDNKPANFISADNLATTPATMQPPPPMMPPPPPSLPTSGAGPAPKLAGEEDMLGNGTAAAAAMPGAHLFDAYMRAALLPRGPPKFLEKAYGGAEPLSRSEFEHSQDDYRRRYNLPPIRRSRRSRSRSPGRRRRSRERERGDRSSRRSRSRSRTRDRSRERDRDRSKKTSSSRRDRSSERGSSRRDKDRSSREKERERRSSREREKEKSKSSRSRSGKEKDVKKDSKTPSVPPETQPDEEKQREKSADGGGGGENGAENGAENAAGATTTTTKGAVSATPTLDNSREPELDYESSDLEEPTAAVAAEAKNQKTSAEGADDKSNNKNKNNTDNDEKHGSRKPIVWPSGDKDKKESSDRHRRGDDRKKDDKKKDDKSSSRRDRDRDSTRDARTTRPPSSSRRDGDRDRERDSGRERGRDKEKEKESSRRRGSSRDRKRGRSAERNGKDNKADGGGSKRERRD